MPTDRPAAAMDIGIGLPSMIPGIRGEQLLEWAQRAEEKGFSSLGTLDRLVYGNCEPLISLAAAAAVTKRIRLATTVLVAPYRANAAVVAKQAATIDHISGGRLVLGAAVGIREDDYAASGVDFHGRGDRFDEMLREWQRVWGGESFGTAGAIGPRSPNGRPTLMIGGMADAAFRRAARYADGWIMGGGTPDQLKQGAEKANAAWEASGRPGRPRTMAIAYFALGPRADQAAERYLLDYYAFIGDTAHRIVQNAATDETKVRQAIRAFADAGCDELILLPCDDDLEQVSLLADVIRQ